MTRGLAGKPHPPAGDIDDIDQELDAIGGGALSRSTTLRIGRSDRMRALLASLPAEARARPAESLYANSRSEGE
jgi:hypothetical protein